jgi:hypothetical protein
VHSISDNSSDISVEVARVLWEHVGTERYRHIRPIFMDKVKKMLDLGRDATRIALILRAKDKYWFEKTFNKLFPLLTKEGKLFIRQRLVF